MARIPETTDLCRGAVDSDRRPVSAGRASHGVHATNLYNHALTLILFVITDELTVLDHPLPVRRPVSPPES